MVPFTIDPDITKAQTLPSAWYRDAATYTEVLERILLPSWQFIASTSELDNTMAAQGSTQAHGVPTVAVPTTMLPGSLDEPIMLLRDDNGTRVLSNVCTHRGNLLVRQACALREIRCMYHGRRFDTSGRLINMPEFKEVCDFPTDADNLRELDHGTWAQMHFSRAQRSPFSAPFTVPFTDWIAVLDQRLSFLSLDRGVHQPELDRDFTVAAHWALYVENYLEGFHIPFVHPGLNAVLEWNSYETLCNDVGVLQIGIAKPGDIAFELPEGHIDFGKRVAAYYYWMFPNIMINVYPWGISLNIVLPQALDNTIIRYRTYVWDSGKQHQGAGSGLDTVEAEDDDVVEHQQKGMQSRIYTRGRYSPKREQGVHHFHRMLQASLL